MHMTYSEGLGVPGQLLRNFGVFGWERAQDEGSVFVILHLAHQGMNSCKH